MADLAKSGPNAQTPPASVNEMAAILRLPADRVREILLKDQAPLTVSEAAAALGVVNQTVYNLAYRGDLLISKILGKSVIFRDDFEAYKAKARGAFRKGGANG